ncbi:MAG: 16S rRNA (guanine(527)-N(7))-methyltransferase RsmG [Oscillospiraceae bacterium]|nr:16S rRNA (guanine(527)-N(7))-methyltransferase RsmG [Oscillospiraceae bacterium]
MAEQQLETILRQGLEGQGLPADGETLRRFRVYYENLEKMNQVMNLTAISGEEDAARLHFLDCASIAAAVQLQGKSLIDVGTGAGFPGLVLKILCPSLRLTLLDSLDKRLHFLADTCEKLGFDDVQLVHARAEEPPEGFREAFDFASARAVARLNVLCELCLPYVKEGGAFLAMKGPELDAELKEAYVALRTLGGTLERQIACTVPGADLGHRIALIRKSGPSPKKYPRRWAQIKKKPL